MYKLYNTVKYKTRIKGFWKDSKGKVYIDNILIKNYDTVNLFVSNKKYLYRQGEKAVFYIYNGKAHIESANGSMIILKNCIRYNVKNITKDYIKNLLVQHEGLTVYKRIKYYTIEYWTV